MAIALCFFAYCNQVYNNIALALCGYRSLELGNERDLISKEFHCSACPTSGLRLFIARIKAELGFALQTCAQAG